MEFIIIFTVFLNILGGIAYIKDTLKGKTKPNRVTWGIWATAPLIGSAGMYFSGGFTWNILPVFIAGFIPFLVFVSSFVNPNSYWELKKLDYICLILAILALVLWGITKNPLLAIVFGILADLFAALPLIVKIYKFPETENIFPYLALLVANLAALLIIKKWEIEEFLFPLYLVLLNSILIIAYYGKKLLGKK